MDKLWLFVVAGGPIIIAIAIIYGMMRRRRLTPGEKEASHRATQQLYGEDREPRSRQ